MEMVSGWLHISIDLQEQFAVLKQVLTTVDCVADRPSCRGGTYRKHQGHVCQVSSMLSARTAYMHERSQATLVAAGRIIFSKHTEVTSRTCVRTRAPGGRTPAACATRCPACGPHPEPRHTPSAGRAPSAPHCAPAAIVFITKWICRKFVSSGLSARSGGNWVHQLADAHVAALISMQAAADHAVQQHILLT